MNTDRLAGHALQREGKAFEQIGNLTYFTGYAKGVALCECGETSAVLDSTNSRKRWHKIIHKPAVREEMATDGSRT